MGAQPFLVEITEEQARREQKKGRVLRATQWWRRALSAADEEAEVGVPVVCEAARYAARRLAVPPCAGLGHTRFLLGARIVT